MKKLELIVSKALPFAQVDFSKYQKDIEEATFNGHTVSVMAGAYLDGKVQDEMGYDIVAVLNGENCVDFERENYKKGIYEAILKDYPNTLKAFLWNTKQGPRGLIVDPGDEKALEKAKEEYELFETIL